MDDQQKNRMKPPKRPQPAITDDRFAHALNDPIFRRVPRKEKRVDIDKRFQSMFHVRCSGENFEFGKTTKLL